MRTFPFKNLKSLSIITLAITLAIATLLVSCQSPTQPELKPQPEPQPEQPEPEFRSPMSFFPDPKAKILVVGTFHFNYPNLDAHKTEKEKQIDILSPKRQEEVKELVAYIKQFKPTKIALESHSSSRLTQRLRAYKSDSLELNRSEHDQIGLRLAKEMDLDTLYGLDTQSLYHSIKKDTEAYFDSIAPGYDFHSDSRLNSLRDQWAEYEDRLKLETTLLDYFKHLNSPEYHQLDYGAYLIGDFKIGEHGGADVLAAYWYSRNLRLFRKIQNIIESPEDRVLVIFGNGHAALLRQFIESSPEFDYIEFDELGEWKEVEEE
jgi:hypothetical protein